MILTVACIGIAVFLGTYSTQVSSVWTLPYSHSQFYTVVGRQDFPDTVAIRLDTSILDHGSSGSLWGTGRFYNQLAHSEQRARQVLVMLTVVWVFIPSARSLRVLILASLRVCHHFPSRWGWPPWKVGLLLVLLHPGISW